MDSNVFSLRAQTRSHQHDDFNIMRIGIFSQNLGAWPKI